MTIDMHRVTELLDRLDPQLDSVCAVPGCTHVDAFHRALEESPPVPLAA